MITIINSFYIQLEMYVPIMYNVITFMDFHIHTYDLYICCLTKL